MPGQNDLGDAEPTWGLFPTNPRKATSDKSHLKATVGYEGTEHTSSASNFLCLEHKELQKQLQKARAVHREVRQAGMLLTLQSVRHKQQ
mmetsp:Transcript_24212/g.52707  ORF Transcript_24212/g.52707 Transcript_24212/m.52707 type:complete len:89 (+) Transcript_24212:936-1202(+)